MTQGETPDAKSKRMAREVPERIAAAREAAREVYDVVQPADARKPRTAAKKPAADK